VPTDPGADLEPAGELAAAAGLTVFPESLHPALLYEYLNIRGDELAGLMARVAQLEAAA